MAIIISSGRDQWLSLGAKSKLGFIDGSIAKSIDGDPKLEAWIICNAAVTVWLQNSCEPDIAQGIIYMHSARHIWLTLEECYGQPNAPRL